MASEAKVAAVVVTHQSEDVVGPLLRSLRSGTVVPARTVVVDNASTDRSVAMAVTAAAAGSSVLVLSRNEGFGAGVNRGVSAAGPARAYLILNADVVVSRHCVEHLVRALEQDRHVGCAVPRLLDGAGRPTRSIRREPSIARTLGETLLPARWAGRWRHLGEVDRCDRHYAMAGDVDWATGAVLLLSGDCWAAAGPFDESFFLYSEETDLLLRGRDRGFRTRFVPDAVAVHAGGALHRSPALHRLQAVNRVRLYRRRHGRLASATFHVAVLLHELRRAANPASRAAAAALVRRPGERRLATSGRRALEVRP